MSPVSAEEPLGETTSTKYRTTFDDKKVNYRFYLITYQQKGFYKSK